MHDRDLHIRLGAGALVASGFLLFVAIPTWVSSPSNVPNIILSPLFWPNTLAVLTGIVGLGLILTSLRHAKGQDEPPGDVADRRAAIMRLGLCGLFMIITMFAMPRIGLVWTAMLDFGAFAFLVRTSHPKTALICAVLMPLFLYVFFAHAAGVAIPQGNFVRLP